MTEAPEAVPARRRRRRWLLWGYLALLGASHAARLLSPTEHLPDPDEREISVRAVSGEEELTGTVRIAYRAFAPAASNESPPANLLVHGSPGDNDEVTEIGALLGQRYRAIAPDLPGFGGSSWNAPDYSNLAHARYLLQQMDSLGIPLPPTWSGSAWAPAWCSRWSGWRRAGCGPSRCSRRSAPRNTSCSATITSTTPSTRRSPIESLLKEDFLIEQAMVVGDQKKFVSALLVPSLDALKVWCEGHHVPWTSLDDVIHNDAVISRFQHAIDKVNTNFSHIEQIKKFALISSTWEATRNDGKNQN